MDELLVVSSAPAARGWPPNYFSVRHHLVEMENKERVEREEREERKEREERVDREEGREDSYIPTGEGRQRSEVQPPGSPLPVVLNAPDLAGRINIATSPADCHRRKVQHCTALYCTGLHCTALHYVTLQYTTQC